MYTILHCKSQEQTVSSFDKYIQTEGEMIVCHKRGKILKTD